MNQLNIFCIGDPHIRIQEEEDVLFFYNQLNNYLSSNSNIDMIIILGDILHNHETLHTESLNLAIKLFKYCKSFAKTFCLVGNHDYTNNSGFLKDNHWMNVCKEWDIQFIVVDNPITFTKNNFQLTLCPYVPDGRFVEALNTETNSNWKQSSVIFGHQLLNGAKMGSIIAENIEEWKDNYPLLISGHIHTEQKVKENYYCIGSSRYIGYGDLTQKYCLHVCLKKENDIVTIQLKKVNLKLHKKECFTILLTNDNIHTSTIQKIDKLKQSKNCSNTKLIFKGNIEVLKHFKQSSLYKDIVKEFNKIVFKADIVKQQLNTNTNTNNMVDNESQKKTFFTDILKENIKDNIELINLYKEFVK